MRILVVEDDTNLNRQLKDALTEGGYVVKDRDGRRNRYQIQSHLPLREAITQQRTIGEVLKVLVESDT